MPGETRTRTWDLPKWQGEREGQARSWSQEPRGLTLGLLVTPLFLGLKRDERVPPKICATLELELL